MFGQNLGEAPDFVKSVVERSRRDSDDEDRNDSKRSESAQGRGETIVGRRSRSRLVRKLRNLWWRCRCVAQGFALALGSEDGGPLGNGISGI